MLVGKPDKVSLIPLAAALALHLAKLGARARAWHNIVRAAYPTDRPRFRAFVGGVPGRDGRRRLRAGAGGQLVRLGLLRSRVSSWSLPGLVSTPIAESVFDAALTAPTVIAVLIAAGPGAAGGASFSGPLGQHPVIAGLAAVALTLAGCGLALQRRARIRSLLRDARIGLAVRPSPPDTYARWRHGRRLAARCGSLRPTGSWSPSMYPRASTRCSWPSPCRLIAGAVPLTPGGGRAHSKQSSSAPFLRSRDIDRARVRHRYPNHYPARRCRARRAVPHPHDRITPVASDHPRGPARVGRRPLAGCPALADDSARQARPPPHEEQRDIDTKKNRCGVAGPPHAAAAALLQTSTPTAGPPPLPVAG